MSWKTTLTGAAAGVAAGVLAERLVKRALIKPDGMPVSELATTTTEVRDGFVSADDGAVLHYREAGSGRATILLVHGMMLDGRIYNQQLDALRDHFRVITFDQRGHGESEVLNMGSPVSEGFGPDIAALLRGLDLDNVVLVGHSLGGIATQQFLCDFPEERDARVIGAVLLSTTPAATTSLVTQQVPRSSRFSFGIDRGIERVMQSTAGITGTGVYMPFMNGDAARLGVRATFGRRARQGDVELVCEMVRNTDPETFAGVIRSLEGFDVIQRLGDVPTESMVVVGTRDLVTSAPMAAIIERALPNVEAVSVEGAGHNIMLEEPDYLSDLLARFTSRCAA